MRNEVKNEVTKCMLKLIATAERAAEDDCPEDAMALAHAALMMAQTYRCISETETQEAQRKAVTETELGAKSKHR